MYTWVSPSFPSCYSATYDVTTLRSGHGHEPRDLGWVDPPQGRSTEDAGQTAIGWSDWDGFFKGNDWGLDSNILVYHQQWEIGCCFFSNEQNLLWVFKSSFRGFFFGDLLLDGHWCFAGCAHGGAGCRRESEARRRRRSRQLFAPVFKASPNIWRFWCMLKQPTNALKMS